MEAQKINEIIFKEKDKIINNLLEKIETNSLEVQKINEKINNLEKQNEITKKPGKSFKCAQCSFETNSNHG